MIITIDGPAGSGKSTIAKILAHRLSFDFFDTGAMYRAVTYYIIENKINIESEKETKEALLGFNYEIKTSKTGEKSYFVNDKDVSSQIRMHEVTQKVSEISMKKYIREFIVTIQRKFAENNDAVFEGRDMGTVVFPYADLKFYLTAEPKIRAERRYLELLDKFPELSHTYNFDNILVDIVKRDECDSKREHSPLKRAKDAHLIDTSKKSIDQVIEKILKKVKKYQKKRTRKCPNFFSMKPFYAFVLFSLFVCFKIFYRLKVYGLKNYIKGPALIVSNHISFLDPPLIAASCKDEIHFLAKESLFTIPFFKWDNSQIKCLSTLWQCA